MAASEVLIDAIDRIQQVVHRAIKGASIELLTYRPDADANSIAWLVWHLTRVQDDHVADAFSTQQLWTSDGWADRFALPFDDAASGYGQSSDDVATVTVGAELLGGYHDAVHDRTVELFKTVTDDDLARVVDESWNPPVTLGVRLVSLIADDLQHVGQASYVRGLAERAGG